MSTLCNGTSTPLISSIDDSSRSTAVAAFTAMDLLSLRPAQPAVVNNRSTAIKATRDTLFSFAIYKPSFTV
jgi:hypothetical protein